MPNIVIFYFLMAVLGLSVAYLTNSDKDGHAKIGWILFYVLLAMIFVPYFFKSFFL